MRKFFVLALALAAFGATTLNANTENACAQSCAACCVDCASCCNDCSATCSDCSACCDDCSASCQAGCETSCK